MKSFNTQPPEGGWAALRLPTCIFLRFQHTAARRRLAAKDRLKSVYIEFQHTAARRRLGAVMLARRIAWPVSTHSRPKAAGYRDENAINQIKRFNTQPPEGGWHNLFWLSHLFCRFNTQPPEGGWVQVNMTTLDKVGFNTQPPEGGWAVWLFLFFKTCRFNTQPPEGGWGGLFRLPLLNCCFNTQPPEGGWAVNSTASPASTRFNTQPPEGGWQDCPVASAA